MVKKTSENRGQTPREVPAFPEILLGRMGFLINKAAQKIRDLDETALKPLGIMGKHLGVLLVLREKGAISQHETGKCIHIDRTTMVDILDDLEKLGLVERKAHPTDRRSHAVYLTAKGKETLPRAHHLGLAVEKKFLSGFSPRERKEFTYLLKRLVLSHYSGAKGKK